MNPHHAPKVERLVRLRNLAADRAKTTRRIQEIQAALATAAQELQALEEEYWRALRAAGRCPTCRQPVPLHDPALHGQAPQAK